MSSKVFQADAYSNIDYVVEGADMVGFNFPSDKDYKQVFSDKKKSVAAQSMRTLQHVNEYSTATPKVFRLIEVTTTVSRQLIEEIPDKRKVVQTTTSSTTAASQ